MESQKSKITNHQSSIPSCLPVEFLGFLSGPEKDRAMREHDCLLFPTHYHGETFGLTIIEAMAYGMPSVITSWRGLTELLPAGLRSCAGNDIKFLADQLLKVVEFEKFDLLRAHYGEHFSDRAFHPRMYSIFKTALDRP